MRRTLFTVLLVAGLLLSILPLGAGAPASALGPQSVYASTVDRADVVRDDVEGSTPATYIIQFQESSLASYRGSVPGLAATSPSVTGEARLDASAPESVAYLEYLQARQQAHLRDVEQILGRPVGVRSQYLNVLNAVAVEGVTSEEATQIARLPGVRAVYAYDERELTTDVGPAHIGGAAVWEGDVPGGVGTRGEGVIIAVLDTGINPGHPSFAATDGQGYTHTNPRGAGNYLGWCVANPSFCNSKLIGAYNFHTPGNSPVDTNGHGSHTAGTAAGNTHTASVPVGGDLYARTISGVAPRANVVAYKVCDPSCPNTVILDAVEQAVADSVHVLNYSISGVDNPWADPVDLAFLDAYNAGIFVSASAGNTGPGPSTVAKTAPWNASVAATTINRIIAHTLDVTGPTSPAELQGLAAVPGENTSIASNISAPIRYYASNNLGCSAFPSGTFTGALALVQRGECTFATKVANAATAGAIGVVVFNHVGGPPSTMGGLTGTPPAVMVDLAGGLALRDHAQANPTTATARINSSTSVVVNDAWQDIVGGFSSRGPSQFDLLAPTFAAPGVNILAAWAEADGNPARYGFQQGTSMAAPHAAGAAALMMALYPTWSPAEIKSALASTSVSSGVTREDGVTPATPFDMGSGRLDLAAASRVGLVLDETVDNFVAANPAVGGDPRTLNMPSLVDQNCVGTCSWTRTVRSVHGTSLTYSVSADTPPGLSLLVSPSSFTLAPGAAQTLQITVNASGTPEGDWAFSELVLTPSGGVTSTLHWPVAVSVPERPSTAAIELSADSQLARQLVGVQASQPLGIRSVGSEDLEWSIGTASGATTGPVPTEVRDLPMGSDRAGAAMPDSAAPAPAAILPTSSTPFLLPGLVEGFDDITLLPGSGWAMINNSSPVGIIGWFQGNSTVFPSQSGAADSYIAANYNGTTSTNTISNWLLTPELQLRNGDRVSFVTRGPAGNIFPDRLQVRLSTSGASVDVGATATSVGDFGSLLLDINPTYNQGGYPESWTQYVATLSGLSGPTTGRIAFRYFVEGGGPSGSRSNYVGIDTFQYTSANILYDNGPFITSYGDGPEGSDVSLLQNVSLGLSTFGATVHLSEAGPHWRVADGFAVTTPGGWTIDEVAFFGYQTGSSTTSSFTGVNYRIWDGPPNDPASNVVYGATSTNRILSTGWTGAYRYAENNVGNTQRPVMYIVAEAGVHLNPGTYWLDWQLAGSIASGPWQPPIARIGEATTGDALQLISTGWQAFADSGAGNPPQGVPFQLRGSTVCDSPSDVSWMGVSPSSGTTAPGESDQVTITTDSTGMALGEHTAYLCVYSNDPVQPLTIVPVTMSVEEPVELNVTRVGNGTVEQSPAPPYLQGTEVTLTATAATGWAFSGWSGAVQSTANPLTLTIQGNTEVTATFVQTCVAVSGVDFGWSPTSPRVGEPVTMTASAQAGTTPLTYTWDLAGTAATGASVSRVFTSPGSHTVRLTVTNACTPAGVQVDKVVTVAPRALYIPLTLRSAR